MNDAMNSHKPILHSKRHCAGTVVVVTLMIMLGTGLLSLHSQSTPPAAATTQPKSGIPTNEVAQLRAEIERLKVLDAHALTQGDANLAAAVLLLSERRHIDVT